MCCDEGMRVFGCDWKIFGVFGELERKSRHGRWGGLNEGGKEDAYTPSASTPGLLHGLADGEGIECGGVIILYTKKMAAYLNVKIKR